MTFLRAQMNLKKLQFITKTEARFWTLNPNAQLDERMNYFYNIESAADIESKKSDKNLNVPIIIISTLLYTPNQSVWKNIYFKKTGL